MSYTDEARDVISQAVRHIKDLPNVQGITIGYKHVKGSSTPVVCAKVSVSKKIDRSSMRPGHRIPRFVSGLITDVDDTPIPSIELLRNPKPLPSVPKVLEGADPYLRSQSFADPFARYDPILCGSSIMPSGSLEYGTLGCPFPIPASNAVGIDPGTYALTCHHVLCALGTYPDAACEVYQPASRSPGPSDVIGNYAYGLRAVPETQGDGEWHDWALIKPKGRSLEARVLGRESSIAGITRKFEVGDRVYKCGARTGYTEGRIAEIGKLFKRDDGTVVNVTNMIFVVGDGDGKWADGGDSGSAVVLASGQYRDYCISMETRGEHWSQGLSFTTSSIMSHIGINTEFLTLN